MMLFSSLAVSVKMNILLFAPALFLAYVATQGVLGTAKQLTICALVQLLLALPFLAENPFNYLKGSFDLGRYDNKAKSPKQMLYFCRVSGSFCSNGRSTGGSWARICS